VYYFATFSTVFTKTTKHLLSEETNRPPHPFRQRCIVLISTLNFVFYEIKLCDVFRLKENYTQWVLGFQIQKQGFGGISLPLKAYQSNFRWGKVTIRMLYQIYFKIVSIKIVSLFLFNSTGTSSLPNEW